MQSFDCNTYHSGDNVTQQLQQYIIEVITKPQSHHPLLLVNSHCRFPSIGRPIVTEVLVLRTPLWTGLWTVQAHCLSGQL